MICCVIVRHSVLAQLPDTLVNDRINKFLLLKEVNVRPGKSISGSKREQQQNSLQTITDKIQERTPGINMIRRGNFAMEPSLRSLSNGQITMTIDGMRIFGACTDRMDPISSYVEPNNLESISVNFNPGENSFGAGIGGGINFKLKEPLFSDGRKLSGMAGTGYESNGNAVQTLAGIEYSTARFAIQMNGIFRSSGNYRAGGSEEILFSQYRKWNGNISAKTKAGKNGTIKADYIQDEGHDIGYPALTMDVAFAKAKIAALSYTYKAAGSGLRLETKAYYNMIDHAMDDTKRPAEMVAMHMDMPGTSRTAGAFSSLSFRLNSRHFFKIQLDGFSNKLDAEMTMYPDSGAVMFMYTLSDLARTDLGINFSDDIFLNRHFDFKIGGRLDYMHDYLFTRAGKDQLSGMFEGDLSGTRWLKNLNVQADFHPGRTWDFSVQLAAGARAATLQEEYSFYIFDRLDGYDYIGNPGLRQERSFNMNLGISYHCNKLKAEINAFRYFIKDYITGSVLSGYSTMTIGARGVKQYVNIPSAGIYGAEAALQWGPLPHLNFTSTNTYTRGNDNSGNALPLIAPLKSVNGVFYTVNKKTALNVESVTNAPQKRVNTRLYGETSTPGLTIVNFGISRDLLLPGSKLLKAGAGIENIFDSRYFQHLDIMKVMRPGRNFLFRLTWLF